MNKYNELKEIIDNNINKWIFYEETFCKDGEKFNIVNYNRYDGVFYDSRFYVIEYKDKFFSISQNFWKNPDGEWIFLSYNIYESKPITRYVPV